MSFIGGFFSNDSWPSRGGTEPLTCLCAMPSRMRRIVARRLGFCHDPRRSHINGQERLVVAIGIWQVFLVLVIAGLVVCGGGIRPGRPPDGAGR
jgi:hypothetical protein